MLRSIHHSVSERVHRVQATAAFFGKALYKLHRRIHYLYMPLVVPLVQGHEPNSRVSACDQKL